MLQIGLVSKISMGILDKWYGVGGVWLMRKGTGVGRRWVLLVFVGGVGVSGGSRSGWKMSASKSIVVGVVE